MAAVWGLPYLAVEDGFLRSVGLGVSGCPPLSVLVDDLGIYYDATRPSRLEKLIGEGCDCQEMALAQEALALVRDLRLSKYNHAPDFHSGLLPQTGRERVLLVDQTRNDVSVELGLADAGSFACMAETARAAHPEADIFFKVHPDVTAGKKRGYLTELDLPGVIAIDRDVNPLSLVSEMDHVYTVTSQLGFEALMLGKPVHCFGMPFYAGWGLTIDALALDRRKATPSLEEVFHAAYIRYARYLDPYTGTRCTIMDTIDTLTDQKRQEDRNRGHFVCAGFSWWRKGFAKHMFKSYSGGVFFKKKGADAVRKAGDIGGRVLVWSAKIPPGTIEAGKRAGVPIVGVEDGFLRSSGLGSDFYFPYSVCMDTRGPYFDPSVPTDLETLLNEAIFGDRLLNRAVRLREAIVNNGVTKYNVGNRRELPSIAAEGRRIVLVVGQVEDDKSVLLGGMGIHSDRDLLRMVRQRCPEAYIIYKPHPDVVSGNRKGGAFLSGDEQFYDSLEWNASLSALFSVIDELHTLTSLSGFEALLRGIPVYTYGGPFYAGWGLTEDRLTFDRRRRKLNINELVAGVLILYPIHYDWRTGLFCGPEVVLKRLADREEPRQGVVRRRICTAIQRIINFSHKSWS
jgi:capsular polysaccharide export protein